MDESGDKLLENRQKKAISFLKKSYNGVSYILLLVLAFFAYWIRTLNLDRLRDITTGGWTLGPDLDPWLFTRWAEYIVNHGSLMSLDTLRYVPLGFETKFEFILLPYLMAWFHKIAVVFGSESVVQSAAVFPAVMFSLTVIAFFFLSRKIFLSSLGEKKSNIIALVSSFFLTVLPVLLPRTVAGIPEKESAAFFFMFLALYFFICSWKSEKPKYSYSYAILAGLSTAAMNLIWGGAGYIYYIIGVSFFLSFFLTQVNKQRNISVIIWLVSTFLIAWPFSKRFVFPEFFVSTPSIIILSTALTFFVYNYIKEKNISLIENNKYLSKTPKTIISFLIVLILGAILGMIFLGPSFILARLIEVKSNLITPITSRLGVTVAENRQPFFNEWANNFGPILTGIPITFWLFIIGSIFLVWFLVKSFNKREKTIITSSYSLFLLALVFSRYNSSSVLNGTGKLSLIVYFMGFLVLISGLLYIYFSFYKNREMNKLESLDFSIVLLLTFFFLSIVSARGAVRLIMMLAPPAAIIISFLAVHLSYKFTESEKGNKRKWFGVLALLIILLTVYSGFKLYEETKFQSEQYAPTVYNQQWQQAMSWVRENTSENSVFGHWWDYGYWIQSIGKRATVLDGGNAISYWNYLMGRYALTGTNNQEALEFLYSHNATHFLIDYTDIGKYGAFSSIGSDENYDRQSYISTFGKDNSQQHETKSGVIYVYSAGVSLDGDIIQEINGSRVFLPAGKAGLIAITVELDSSGKVLSAPHGIYVYQNKQYDIQLRYAYDTELHDFGTGLEAGIFILPVFDGQRIDNTASILYLSPRTVNSQLARLFLYKEDNPYFKLVHTEDDFIVKDLKAQTDIRGDFVYANNYGGLRGPIRIWEINYPTNMNVNQEYLRTDFPDKKLEFAQQ